MSSTIRRAVKADCPRLLELITELAVYEKAPDEVTEQAIRTFVKARLPRLVQGCSGAFLVEEMEVCSGRARIEHSAAG